MSQHHLAYSESTYLPIWGEQLERYRAEGQGHSPGWCQHVRGEAQAAKTENVVWQFRGKPEDNIIKEAKRGKSVNGSSGTQCLSGSEEQKNQGKPMILVMKWSMVVYRGDSLTKLHLCCSVCVSYKVGLVMLYSEGLGPFRPWSRPYCSLLNRVDIQVPGK